MDFSFDLSGKLALVTGGTRGIGLGMAKSLAQSGARVVIISRGTGIEEAVDSLNSIRPGCRGYIFDVSNTGGLEGLCADVESEMGPIDILINNAGVNIRSRADELSLDDWQTVMRVNLDSAFALSSAWGRRRIADGRGGSIIIVTSLASERARQTVSAYAASKGGLRMLVKGLASDWAQFNIRVNGIGPGFILTELNRPLIEDKKFNAWVIERTPMRRWGTPEDIGPVAVFLASDAARFVTGQTIFVDGGWMAGL